MLHFTFCNLTIIQVPGYLLIRYYECSNANRLSNPAYYFIWCDTSVGYEEREIRPSAFQRILAALLEGAERIQSEHWVDYQCKQKNLIILAGSETASTSFQVWPLTNEAVIFSIFLPMKHEWSI